MCQPDKQVYKKELEALRSFRGIGESFKFCGIKMFVLDHCIQSGTGSGIACVPGLRCAYPDEHGILHKESFEWSMFPAIKAQND